MFSWPTFTNACPAQTSLSLGWPSELTVFNWLLADQDMRYFSNSVELHLCASTSLCLFPLWVSSASGQFPGLRLFWAWDGVSASVHGSRLDGLILINGFTNLMFRHYLHAAWQCNILYPGLPSTFEAAPNVPVSLYCFMVQLPMRSL